MKKIVYLFGAGASRQALPIVTEIPQRLQEFILVLKLHKEAFSTVKEIPNIKKTILEIKEVLISDLEWLLVEVSNHASIDTLAKKFFIKEDDSQLRKLKFCLSIFFIYEQLKNKPDNRYDTFFASLLSESVSSLPENIAIVSWNYDMQFELAFSEYSGISEIRNNQLMLNVKSKHYQKSGKESNGFSIFKINGTTGLLQKGTYQPYSYISSYIDGFTIEVLEKILLIYAKARISNEAYSSLSFAWERENKDSNIVKEAIEGTKDASVLVVIGYSFPYFNRNIDRAIIGSMTNLEKVYFQAPDADTLKERFEAINDKISPPKLVSRFDVGQFLLPNEL